ncbi:MAG: hypothetical protein IJK42_08725 [Prevotella sp.]|nr:hypothetical protein [Prevotella sp.]MBQ6209840.1 hypothetical protein [Prevotella sp.]
MDTSSKALGRPVQDAWTGNKRYIYQKRQAYWPEERVARKRIMYLFPTSQKVGDC